MNEHLKLQKQFQTLSGQSQDIHDLEVRKLRLKLIFEEVLELAEAYGLVDTFHAMVADELSKVEIHDTYIYNETEALDALIDIEIINNGTIITQKHGEIYDEAYIEVIKNNLDKFAFEKNIVESWKDEYVERGIYVPDDLAISVTEYEGNIYFSLIDDYGKIIKPFNHSKPNINKYLPQNNQ